MSVFGDRIDALARYRRGFDALINTADNAPRDVTPNHLKEVTAFGSNPGSLRMFSFVPPGLPRGAPLVVVLHGCGQTAPGYEKGAGWSDLAERLGFALLCPEQVRANNAHSCFNWFQRGDVRRGEGEVASIRQMIEHMLVDHGLDRRRVFISGLSAGGAMTAAMLAAYPEVFAAGAIIAGLPYGSAENVQEALETMMTGRARPAEQWAALVRDASPHNGRWPRLSVWHGGSDTTVAPVNAEEIVKQWQAVHGLPANPTAEDVVDGARHRVWRDRRGTVVLEDFIISGLGHGTPIDPNAVDAGRRCGVAGPFLLDAGMPSTLHIAHFWGLLPRAVSPAGAQEKPRPAAKLGVKLEEILGLKAKIPERITVAGVALDPGALIEKALRAAGLMKGGKPS